MPTEGVAGLVAAAGQGTRLGRGPKAFVELAGLSLLARSCDALRPLVDELVVAVPEGLETRARNEVPTAVVVPGGSTRQETVTAMLEATRAELVVIHDAARPFLGAGVVRAVIDEARRGGAATAAVQVADTLFDLHKDATVDRDALRAIQTPQAFRRTLLERAHEAGRAHRQLATDDAGLVRSLGHDVALVEGSSLLFKITTSADMTLAVALAETWDARA